MHAIDKGCAARADPHCRQDRALRLIGKPASSRSRPQGKTTPLAKSIHRHDLFERMMARTGSRREDYEIIPAGVAARATRLKRL